MKNALGRRTGNRSLLRRLLSTIFLGCLTLTSLASVAGWFVSVSRCSWTLNPEGLFSGLRSGNETWHLLATFDRGWLCASYMGHTVPKWPKNWECGGLGAVRFDGLTRGGSCPWASRSGWPVPKAGRWELGFRTEQEVADWVVCRNSAVPTEIFSVRDHAQWLRARMETDVWSTPARMYKHIAFWGVIPFWALTLLAGAIPAYSIARWAVYGRRKRSTCANECSECGYDLTGNISGVCPECGHVIDLNRIQLPSDGRIIDRRFDPDPCPTGQLCVMPPPDTR